MSQPGLGREICQQMRVPMGCFDKPRAQLNLDGVRHCRKCGDWGFAPRRSRTRLLLMWPPVEVPLGPHCFLATGGVDDDDEDSGIKLARQEAKVPIHNTIHAFIS